MPRDANAGPTDDQQRHEYSHLPPEPSAPPRQAFCVVALRGVLWMFHHPGTLAHGGANGCLRFAAREIISGLRLVAGMQPGNRSCTGRTELKGD